MMDTTATTDSHTPHTPAAPATVDTAAPRPARNGSPLEVLLVALRLGLTSFGGPIAHLGYFRSEYVTRRRWLDDGTYADIVAMCQFLPGPASSQVGIAIGMLRAGYRGALAAWLGFTLPSALLLLAFAYGVGRFDVLGAGWLHGLKIVAVAVVAQAVWSMAQTLTPDRQRITLALVTAVVLLLWTTPVSQLLVLAVAGVIGWRWLPAPSPVATPAPAVATSAAAVSTASALPPAPTHMVGRRAALVFLLALPVLLLGLPLLAGLNDSLALDLADGFSRAGSLVFGGGHVVLPMLQTEVVPPGWLTNDEFIAGYGAAQAVPGPLFTLSAYLGAMTWGGDQAWIGGSIALLAIFLPSLLLVLGALRYWDALRQRVWMQAALRGVQASVVGLLLAALYDPVWTSAIHAPEDFALGLGAFGLLAVWRWAPWSVVALAALGGELLARV